MKIFSYSCFFLLIIFSCNNTTSKQVDQDSISNKSYSVDSNILNRLDQIWGNYSFTSTEVLQNSNQVEVDLYNYVSLFPQFSQVEIEASLNRLIRKTESNREFFDFIKSKFPYYLNHPNSPVRNDVYFEQVLKIYLDSDSINETDKVKDQFSLDLIQKNKVGSQAANFSFVDSDGKSLVFKDVDVDYKLLVFYDPTCTHCQEVLNQMKVSQVLNQAIANGEVKVLAIDPIGNYKEWKSYQVNIPDNWINGIDGSKSVLSKVIYNILAFPTVYLINRKNEVVLKDVFFSDIEYFLSNN